MGVIPCQSLLPLKITMAPGGVVSRRNVIAMHLSTEFLHFWEEVMLNHVSSQKMLNEDALVLLPIRASCPLEVERFDGAWKLLHQRYGKTCHGYLSMNGEESNVPPQLLPAPAVQP
jgi:hypothetical protein